jgi:transcriptional regulator with XRE-family HTH domain
LEAAKLEDDQVFQTLMHDAQVLLEMSDSEIANSLSISRPTLNRWINGRTTPHVAIRKAAAKWISEQLTARVRRLQTATRSSFGGSSMGAAAGTYAAKGHGNY